MDEALRLSYHEQRIRILLIVHRQLSQHLGQAGIVGAGADQTHSQDRIVRDLSIGIVGELGQGVDNVELGI